MNVEYRSVAARADGGALSRPWGGIESKVDQTQRVGPTELFAQCRELAFFAAGAAFVCDKHCQI